MNIKYNSNVLTKLKGNFKLVKKGVLAGVLSVTMLFSTGCSQISKDAQKLQKALIGGNNTLIAMDVATRIDFEDSKFFMATNDKFAILTSSQSGTGRTFSGEKDQETYDKIVKNLTEKGDKFYNLSSSDTMDESELNDAYQGFNKVVVFFEGNAVILPITWFENLDECQFGIKTEDGMSLLLSCDTAIPVNDVESKMKADAFASAFVGSEGYVLDLSKTNNNSSDNSTVYDSNMYDVNTLNNAIIFRNDSVMIVPVASYRYLGSDEYSIITPDGQTILTAICDTVFVNDTNSKTKTMEIASALGHNREMIDLTAGYNNASAKTR